ncbi:MAG TPA: type II toxin-antitoxin system prevent-host-death family antitoxin [Bryobacteraceae bacterium]|nr:type II toxin-antitoxin system prevent-host-death family antitoxin [Bryobacteraceae bacterium]
MQISIAEAKAKLTQLIHAVEKGEKVTISRHGRPVVDLVPTDWEQRQKPKFGTGKGKFTVDPHAFDPMTDEEVDAFLEGRY